MKIWRTKDRGPQIPNEVVVEDYSDVTHVQFPHCDTLILHSPGTCAYCDRHPDWQALRSAQGIAFSDTSEQDVHEQGLIPCPSIIRRSAEVRDLWHGNVARVQF